MPTLDLLDAYKTAVFEKDTSALMRLYAAEVRVFDAFGTWVYDGADAWRKMIENWFGSLGAERAEVRFEDVQRGVSSITAIVTYTGQSEEGIELRSLQNRLTWILNADGKIVHEHTSVPVDFEQLKPILQRAN